MHVYVIDYETHFSQDYSLSKMTTESYIRNNLFEIIGVGIKVNDEKTRFRSGTHRALQDWMKGEFDWDNSIVVAHNGIFDHAISSWILDIHPKMLADTLSMARAVLPPGSPLSLAKLAERYELGEKGVEVHNFRGFHRADFSPEQMKAYAKYCRNDVNLTYALFVELAKHYTKAELRIIDQTLKMFTEPVLHLDKELLTEHLAEVKLHKMQLLEDASVDLKDLTSNEKFAGLLRNMGVEPPMKISKTTGKEAYAFAKTDEGFKELLEHDDERVQILAAARVGNKTSQEETRTERLIGIADRGLMPVPLKYFGAHTSRWSGMDSINLQNLKSREKDKKKPKLKRSIKAPPGYLLINADSASIEARILAWESGQEDLVRAFAAKRDVYIDMASKIYGRPAEEIGKPSLERDVGKATTLGAGYGMSGDRFNVELKKAGIYMELPETKNIIDIYRKVNPAIVDYWVQCKAALVAMSKGKTKQIGRGSVVVTAEGLRLPTGMYIKYPNLRQEVDAKGQRQYVYDAGRKVKKIYGGAMAENCIAVDTKVLTDNGWKPIQYIQDTDLVHDGVEFVSHGGLVFKSVQPCVIIDGVYMTPDHEVLTNEGWEAASQSPRPYRPDIRGVNSAAQVPYGRTTLVLGFSMPMWGVNDKENQRCYQVPEEWKHAELRMYDETTTEGETHRSWYEPASSVLGVAQYERPMPIADTPSMGELWGAGYNCMRVMAAGVHEFLEGYGTNLPTGIGPGSQRQQWRLHARELQMGRSAHQFHEQKEHRTKGGCWGAKSRYGDWYDYAVLSVGSWMARRRTYQEARLQKPVYDILNCGPRTRFVVMGDSGPFIVHNCIQGLASCVIREQGLLVSKRYRWVLTVHDSIVALAPEDEIDEAVEYVTECMRHVPKWASGLPLDCEVKYARSYGDA